MLDTTRLNPEASRLRDFLQGDPAAILLIELYGDRAELLTPRLDALEDDLRQRGFGYHHLAVTRSGGPGPRLEAAHDGTGAVDGRERRRQGDLVRRGHGRRSRAPARLHRRVPRRSSRATDEGRRLCTCLGRLPARPAGDQPQDRGRRAQFEAIAEEVAELVLKYGGALSGEHGDGLVRSPFQEKMYGPVLYQAFRELKRTFDPHNLLNPGKIVDAPPLATNLRYGPGYVTPDVPTTFDFTADGGLLPAAELCAGVGACRKKREGTMCPSFQATRDEKDSTRGRANLLRLAITGQLGFEGFTDPASTRCSTCASNARRARASARPMSTWPGSRPSSCISIIRSMACPGATGSSATWPSWAGSAQLWRRCRAGWLQSGLVRWLNEKFLGIDRRRMPPAFARRSLVQRFSSLPWNEDVDPSGTSCLAVPRHVHQLLSARGRRRGDRIAAAGRLCSHARPARPALLRPAA